MKRAVLIGGFSTGHGSLERWAGAMTDQGVAKEVDVFTLRQAMARPENVAQAAQGQRLFTHSAAAIALHFCLEEELLPSEVTTYNGPEERSATRLVRAAAILAAEHVATAVLHRDGHRVSKELVLNGIQETGFHPDEFLRVPGISRFCTFEALKSLADRGVTATMVVGRHDTFFPLAENPHLVSRMPPGIRRHIIDGPHDWPLRQPEKAVRLHIKQSERRQRMRRAA